MTDATELDLDAIRARLDAATEHVGRLHPDARPDSPNDRQRGVIAASLADVERLLAALDEAQAEARGWADEARGLHAEVGELTSALRAAESSLAAVRALADEAEELASEFVADYEGEHPGNRAEALVSVSQIRAALAPTPPDENPATTERTADE